MTREKEIELDLRRTVERHGGWALKFISPGMDGVPDRIVLLPGGKLIFVELKAPAKSLRSLQQKRKEQLEALGFQCICINSHDAIRALFKEDDVNGVSGS